MSEERAVYSVDKKLPATLEAFNSRPCALLYSEPGYTPPTPEEINRLIELAGWSQTDIAKITGVNYNPKKGSPTVRRWKSPIDSSEHRSIPYAAWRLMLLTAGSVDKII